MFLLFLLFGFLVPLVMLLVFAQLLFALVAMLAPIFLVLFGCWVIYRLVRRRR